jgi:class 3 adenylate cyclase
MHSVLYIPKEGKVCSAVEKNVMLDFIKRMYRQRLVLSYHRFGGEIMFINESLTYPERDTIPKESSLTYDNGFYVNVVAIYTDIVGSSKLLDGHKRPTLARLYREFISKAIEKSYGNSQYITIQGDCVGAVFNVTQEKDMNFLFNIALSIDSMQRELADKYRKQSINFGAGIGMAYGRALMIKAGLKGSGINDILWIGDVVNHACHFCNAAGRNGYGNLIISDRVYNKLNSKNKENLSRISVDGLVCYERGRLSNPDNGVIVKPIA